MHSCLFWEWNCTTNLWNNQWFFNQVYHPLSHTVLLRPEVLSTKCTAYAWPWHVNLLAVWEFLDISWTRGAGCKSIIHIWLDWFIVCNKCFSVKWGGLKWKCVLFQPGFRKFWKKIFQSEASIAMMQDSFWWIFIELFQVYLSFSTVLNQNQYFFIWPVTSIWAS